MNDTFTKSAPARSAKEQFDRQASHYDTQWNTWNEESLAWMLSNSGAKSTDRVLDVATGAGFTALGFAPHVKEVIGLDVSTGMLAQARANAAGKGIENVAFQEGAAEELPFGDASFGIVTCRVAAHHFLDVHQFAREAVRVLAPGGRLLVADTTVPDGSDQVARWQNGVEALRDPSHIQNYSPSEWRVIVEAAGFTVQEITSTGGGITIPLTDWMVKAGCSEAQRAEVRRCFAEAPEGARKAFCIEERAGETYFTWPRVALRAVKALG